VKMHGRRLGTMAARKVAAQCRLRTGDWRLEAPEGL